MQLTKPTRPNAASSTAATITAGDLWETLRLIDENYEGDGSLYLIGETSHVAEGWREWTTQIEFFGDVVPIRKAYLHEVVDNVCSQTGLRIIDEFPGDLIPLPDGYMDRARDLADTSVADQLTLKVRHFDPYSVVYRYIARGDEPDYHIALMYLDKGWITFEEMNERLDGLLPKFSLETIAQDPAEFRRKYRGLTQMWRKKLRPRTIHRPTET